MGLDREFLALLTASMVWLDTNGRDQWGNESVVNRGPQKCFIEDGVSRFARAQFGSTIERDPKIDYTILSDALGIEVNDFLTFKGGTFRVTQQTTTSDEFGASLLQTILVTSEGVVVPVEVPDRLIGGTP